MACTLSVLQAQADDPEGNRHMEIQFAKTHDVALFALHAGAIPMECSFGNMGSVVDSRFVMDHHGTLSHLEGVAIRAYRDHFGALRQQFQLGVVKFVVTGAADADACFAIASLIGELPHPSRAEEFAKYPHHVQASMTRDLTDFAKLVNQMDTAPIGVHLEDLPYGDVLMLWNQMASSVQDCTAFHSGVDRWRALFGRPLTALLAATKAEKAEQVAKAREAVVTRVSDKVCIVVSDVWGFDVWYGDHAPVIVALTPLGNVTIGCPDTETAEALFGPGGLKNVFGKLEPQGWGGREAIGGSPRSMAMTIEQAAVAAATINACLLSSPEV